MNKYMKLAKELADNNIITNDGGPFGACIVKDGKVIGRGANRVLVDKDPTAHAEIVAIRNACKTINSYDLTGCEIYTSCYPCPMCASAIIWSNISKVYYGNTKEDAEMTGFKDKYIYDTIEKINKNEKNDIEFSCLDHEETIKSFNEYMKSDNKKMY